MPTTLKTALRYFPIVALISAVSGCSANAPPSQASESPAMRWDFHPEGSAWTKAVMAALNAHGAPLAQTVPSDIEQFCPSYAENSLNERQAFWAGLFSALAKHESTWNPEAAGGGGRWIGLLQISPRTARYYDCSAQTPSALKDGAANLSCAVRIATVQVLRDNAVAGNGAKGVGRDWAPFRSSSKRTDMADWTRAQTYCQ